MEEETAADPAPCSRRRLALLVAVAVVAAAAVAAVVHWQSGLSAALPPPYLRLRALIEEPHGRGWGVDIPGYGPSLNFSLLQVARRLPAQPPRRTR
jgi:hypothetical protein